MVKTSHVVQHAITDTSWDHNVWTETEEEEGGRRERGERERGREGERERGREGERERGRREGGREGGSE